MSNNTMRQEIWIYEVLIRYILLCFPVGDPPEFLGEMADQVVVAPNEAKLSCKIKDVKPKPNISWFKNGREMYPDRRYRSEVINMEATFIIPQSEANDDGQYMCRQENKLGSAEAEASLTIHGQFH